MADDPLNTIQPNRNNLSSVWNFATGCLKVNNLDVLTSNNGVVLTDAGNPNKYLRRDANGTVQSSLLLAADMPSAIDAAKIGGGNVSNTEFGYLDGVSSALQGQIDGKEPTITALPIAKGGTGQTVAANALNALLPTQGGNSGKFLQTDGANASWQTAPGAAAPEVINGIGATTTATLWNDNGSASIVLLNGATRALFINSTNLEYKLAFGTSKNIPAYSNAQRSDQPVTVGPACRISLSATDYMLGAADGGDTLYRWDSDGQNRATCSFVGTAPTAIRRIGWDPVNSYVLIQDGADKAATQIRRYTISGTTLTNINNDIVLSSAPTDEGSGEIHVGTTYIVLCDTITATAPVFKRYNLSGTLVDSLTVTMGSFYHGMATHPTYQKIYVQLSMSNSPTSSVNNLYLLDIS